MGHLSIWARRSSKSGEITAAEALREMSNPPRVVYCQRIYEEYRGFVHSSVLPFPKHGMQRGFYCRECNAFRSAPCNQPAHKNYKKRMIICSNSCFANMFIESGEFYASVSNALDMHFNCWSARAEGAEEDSESSA